MGSGKKRGYKILGVLDRADAERFLADLANLKGDTNAARRLYRRNKEILEHLHDEFEKEAGDPVGGWFQFGLLRRRLQKAWETADARSRRWYSMQMRVYSWRDANEAFFKVPNSPDVTTTIFEDAPPPTPFEAALWYFEESIGDRAKKCLNQDCPAPYFIATKRWQKYCSEACAGPANREAKRKWWREYGSSKRGKAAI
jgi:hypothetical protein